MDALKRNNGPQPRARDNLFRDMGQNQEENYENATVKRLRDKLGDYDCGPFESSDDHKFDERPLVLLPNKLKYEG